MNSSSPIGFGTAAIGRPQYINIRQGGSKPFEMQQFRQQGMDMLNHAYRLGIRYFDTAPGYGMAEKLLTDWVKAKDDLQLELATKWGYTYVADFRPDAKVHEVKEHSLAKLNEQWDSSRLLLPKLTTYQIHSATFDTGVLGNQAILERLGELKALHGLHMGLSTTGNNQLEVLKMASKIEVEGKLLFDVFQVTYNLFDQSLAGISDELKSSGARLVIKEALANGRIFPNSNYPDYEFAYKKLQQLAAKYETGIDAVALRFCLDSIQPFIVLSGASTAEQLQQNMDALRFKLNEEELEELKDLKVLPDLYWAERKKLTWN
ncbi:MAG: aldo/keto reductase [Bacteroidia bacterium]|nr:aldo/keto reductase [Bacteroidia bacterium]